MVPETGDVRPAYVDPRVERTRELLIQTAADILREKGMTGVTFDAVSGRSRVSRSTIYRHFAERNDLLVATIAHLLPPVPVPEASGNASIVERLESFLEAFVSYLTDRNVSMVMPILLSLAGDDPALRDRVGAEHRHAILAIVRQGIAHGELAHDTDADLSDAELVGPILWRSLMTRQPVTTATIRAIATGYVRAHAPTTDTRAGVG